jgi:hypothetical protein
MAPKIGCVATQAQNDVLVLNRERTKVGRSPLSTRRRECQRLKSLWIRPPREGQSKWIRERMPSSRNGSSFQRPPRERVLLEAACAALLVSWTEPARPSGSPSHIHHAPPTLTSATGPRQELPAQAPPTWESRLDGLQTLALRRMAELTSHWAFSLRADLGLRG